MVTSRELRPPSIDFLMAQRRDFPPPGSVIQAKTTSSEADAASDNTTSGKSTSSAGNSAQQQAPLNSASQANVAFQSQAKKPETGQRNGRKNRWREVTGLKAMFQKMQWPASPRKDGFDDIKLLMNRAPWSAWLATAHHLLAIASAVIIVALNAAGSWVGKELTGTSGQDTEKLLALQFAAKLHELLMLSSLGQILFSETVKQLVFGEGLPFGAIAAGLQFNQISYLWSKEFRATSCATFKRKYLIIPAIIICTLLGVSIGPSSATAIKPTLGDRPAGETSFWLNATAQELWPSTLSLIGNKTCTNSPETCGSLHLGLSCG